VFDIAGDAAVSLAKQGKHGGTLENYKGDALARYLSSDSPTAGELRGNWVPDNPEPSEVPAGWHTQPSNTNPTRERIEAFIEKLRDAGHRITRTDIWHVAGYGNPTEFQRFQREDRRATCGSAAKFNLVLNMSPEAFMEKLEKRRST
jgi:hypothetical protein